MAAGKHRTSQVILVVTLVALFVSLIVWFLAAGVTLPVLACIVPIVAAAYVLLGGILWLVLADDEAPA